MLRTLSLLTISACLALAADNSVVERAERDFGKALAGGDVARLDKLISNDLLYTHSGGNTDTKISYLDGLKSGNLRYALFEYQNLEVKPYGDTALVFGVVHVKSVTKGTPSESHLRIIHVWVKQGGAWKLVAHQSTKLPS